MTRTLGLTGSIGMGKSTVAGFFADCGADVWDADAAVHDLYKPDAAGSAAIAKLCPDAVTDTGVDRQVLAAAIAKTPALLGKIEAAIHPLVAQDRAQFITASKAPLVVLDIPLLFENGSEALFDAVCVVSAPPEVQRDRVLARPGMTPEKFEMILSRQMPDAEKRRRADYIIETAGSLGDTRKAVEILYESLIGQ